MNMSFSHSINTLPNKGLCLNESMDKNNNIRVGIRANVIQVGLGQASIGNFVNESGRMR